MTRVGNWSKAQLRQEQLVQSAAMSELPLSTQLPALPATLADTSDLEAQQAVDTALQTASRPAESGLGSGLGIPSASAWRSTTGSWASAAWPTRAR